MKTNIFLLLAGFLYFTSCDAQPNMKLYNNTESALSQSAYYDKAPYDFLNPQKAYTLPGILREISGIAIAGENTLFCIQDEAGTVFKYDTQNEKISGKLDFTGSGDFEDIFIKNDFVYVLRSDGMVFYFNHKNFDNQVKQVEVPLNCQDIEGVCFNKFDNLVYFACKDELIDDNKQKRVIYQASLEKLNQPQIAFTIDLEEINKMVSEKYPALEDDKVKFNPSAIAIHPKTRERYVLSSNDRFLAIFDDNGLSNIYPLSKSLFPQPEGLAFTADGDLYISSEGKKKGNGRILFFSRR
ncbi:MAG: hypothetical protein DHS20C18_08340 [Saprospiraceae bacterium]|nr:MAG: hypothetical protein DHS20C18_08340 [Saprospiraceae bacterium]